MMDNNNFQPQPPISPQPPSQPAPPVVLPPQFQPQPTAPKRKLPIKLIIIIAASLLLLAGIGALIMFVISSGQRSKLETSVKSTLVSVATTYSQATKNGDGYPIEIPESAKTTNVKLEGGGSVDGTTYCVTGTSTEDKTVVYSVSSQAGTPQKGSCITAGGDKLELSTTGTPSIALTTTEAIKLSWNLVPGAKNYTVQCSTSKDFSKDVVEVKTDASAAQCGGLKDGTDYFVRVQAVGASVGPWSEVAEVSTSAISIAPTDLKLDASANAINYSWKPVSGATAYVVEWATDVNFVKNKGSLTTTNASGVTSGLLANTVYWYHVKAITPNFDISHAAFSPPIDIRTK